MKQNLHTWLMKYKKYQPEITLCSRDTAKSWWGGRVKFLDEDYNNKKYKHYNHRLVLDKEAVIEYDYPEPEFNFKLIKRVEEQLQRDKIKYALYFSGGKSYHLHLLFNPKNASRLQLLKKVIIRYYGTIYTNPRGSTFTQREYEDLSDVHKDRCVRHLPDMRLAEKNHLVRAEYGLHEASGQHKRTVRRDEHYADELSTLPMDIWKNYSRWMTTVIKRDITVGVGDLVDSPEVKLMLSTTDFKKLGDGKKRVLYILINLLKKSPTNPNGRYDKKELIELMWDWYKYVGGYSMTKFDIDRMVVYYWNRDYSRMSIGYIRGVLEELGAKIAEKEVKENE